jgi:hypothetical protein
MTSDIRGVLIALIIIIVIRRHSWSFSAVSHHAHLTTELPTPVL